VRVKRKRGAGVIGGDAGNEIGGWHGQRRWPASDAALQKWQQHQLKLAYHRQRRLARGGKLRYQAAAAKQLA